MASLPYVTAPGNIEKALAGIKSAAVPERVSQDFVKTILKIPGGSGDQMTTFLKKIGFSSSDGLPTELYSKFRNPSTSGPSLAEAMKHAYAPLYVKNEFAHELQDNDLIGLIMEETGQPHDSASVKKAAACFKALNNMADFSENELIEDDNDAVHAVSSVNSQEQPQAAVLQSAKNVGLNIGYTINLNLPATSDPAVFNAIFKSLKQNLLSDDDG
jgi:hypothetical protein